MVVPYFCRVDSRIRLNFYIRCGRTVAFDVGRVFLGRYPYWFIFNDHWTIYQENNTRALTPLELPRRFDLSLKSARQHHVRLHKMAKHALSPLLGVSFGLVTSVCCADAAADSLRSLGAGLGDQAMSSDRPAVKQPAGDFETLKGV